MRNYCGSCRLRLRQIAIKYSCTEHSLSRVNGKRDNETDFDYRIARMYSLSRQCGNAEIGRFLSVDPMAAEAMDWTCYRYAYDNPIRLVDPNGMFEEENDWEPKPDRNLISQKNDNARTLSKNYGIPLAQAEKLILNQKLRLDKDGFVLPGQELEFENDFTNSIKSQYFDKIGYKVEGKDDFNNCHGVTCNGGGYMNESVIDYHLKRSYIPVEEDQIKPGEPVVRWGGKINGYEPSNLAIHTATVYGFSNSGEMYVVTANGFREKIHIEKFSNVNSKYFHAEVLGVYKGTSGYYNIKR